MPLTAKGQEIKAAMQKEYGAKHGEEVFYASRNAGTITGVDGLSNKGNRVAPASAFELPGGSQ